MSLKFLIKIPLNEKKLSLLSTALGERPYIFPKKRGPCGNRRPFPELYLAYFRGHQKRSLPSRFPSQSSFRERCPIPRAFLHSSFTVLGTRAPFQVPQWGPYGDARLQSLFYIFSRVPSKEVRNQVPLTELPQRSSTARIPFIHLSKSLVNEPPSRFHRGATMEIPVSRAFST